MLRRAHLDRIDPKGVEHLAMLAERALEREDTDLHAASSRAAHTWGPRVAHRALPAPVGELDLERVDLRARHRRTETARHLGDDRGVVVVRRVLDDGLGHHLRLLAIEDARADEHRRRTHLHDEGGVCWLGNASGSKY